MRSASSMTEIYGMVAGYHHGNQEQDCSRPCLFLENGRCRVKGEAECVANMRRELESGGASDKREPMKWTEEELEAIRSMTVGKASAATGRTPGEVAYMRRKLGVKGSVARRWTDDEVRIMLSNPDNGVVAEILGRTKEAVRTKRSDIRNGRWKAVEL